jgi:hypothetical protein
MPRDVRTRWNSTFDMLDFALLYRVAINAITDKARLGLVNLALDDDEWELLRQLRDVLKVSLASYVELMTHPVTLTHSIPHRSAT